MDFSTLVGKTLMRVEQKGTDRIEFDTDAGDRFVMFHDQDCCEGVDIQDIAGELSDLVGAPILFAEESTNSESDPDDYKREYPPDSFTWTFYRIGTIKGSVVIRWLGESNGYYSESVAFESVSA